MPQSSPELADQLIARLTELCQKPETSAVLGRLLEKQTPAPEGSFPLRSEKGDVGLLHVLNAIVGVDKKGHGLIAVTLTEEHGFFQGFQRYVAPVDTEETKPATPVAKSLPPAAADKAKAATEK